MSELITVASNIAAWAHAGQKCRFTGEIYLRHPMRVASMVRTRGGSETEVIGAILHDVLEDSRDLLVTETEILINFGPEMVKLCKSLARKRGESYMDYIRRCAADPSTKLIKECDLDDHLDLKRLEKALPFDVYSGIIVENEGMFKKYAKAKRIIKDTPVS